MIELEHSPLGGSSAERFMTCEYSFLEYRRQLAEGTHENVESEYAKLGTGAHELGAVCLVSDAEPFEYLGEQFNGYIAGWPEGIALDAVSVYVNECRSIMEREGYNGLAIVERTYHLPHIHRLLKGTVDFGYLAATRIYLRDYKNGEGIGVSAAMNKQLLYYAFLLLADMKIVDREMVVDLGIVQPNFYGVFEAADVWETTVGFVLDWGWNQLLPVMRRLDDRTEEPTEADAVPGGHCQFCPVLLDCPKMQQAFREYADAEQDFITMLSNQELDHYYGQREYARRFMNALEDTVRARMIAKPGCITSAKLVEKKVARVWKPGAHAALQEAFGDKAFKPKEVLSPAGVEKLSSRGKEMATEWGYKPESAGLTIAPLSDPRAEAKPRTNETVFASHAVDPVEAGW